MFTITFWMALSFLIFLAIFWWKLKDIVIAMLDEYIFEVKKKIETAEKLNEDSFKKLRNVRDQKKDFDLIIKGNEEVSQKKLAELELKHKCEIEDLSSKYSQMYKLRLESDLQRQKQKIISEITDVVIEKIKAGLKNEQNIDFVIKNIQGEDVKKLF